MYVEFQEWTRGRGPVVLGTNAGSAPLAFQTWRRFKEAFAPELIHRAALETSAALGRPVRSCADPFSGSGTTALACQFLGVKPVVIEVNPFLADLTEAKLTPLDSQVVARRLAEVLVTGANPDPLEVYAQAPPTFIEPGKDGKYLFSSPIARRLAALISEIERLPEPEIARLFRVLLGSAALDVSNAVVSGKGRRYRRNWRSRYLTPTDLDAAFQQAVVNAVYDITRYSNRRLTRYQLVRGDAREQVFGLPPDLDLAIFSPPYPNSFDYTDVYNIELWALRYLKRKEDNTSLRMATLRSHVQIKRDFSAKLSLPLIEDVVERMRRSPDLWNPHLPEMIRAYFADIGLILTGIMTKLSRGGRVYMVVGDSQYAGVHVPVGRAIAELAPGLGYRLIASEPFRSMRASPQQGGRQELPETLLVLSTA